MNAGLPEITSEVEARAMMLGGLARAELEFVTSMTAPLSWVIRKSDGSYRVRNGSVFFLDAGAGPFAITAHHVIEEWRQHREYEDALAIQMGDQILDLADRNAVIDAHAKLDILTFRVTADEVASISKIVLTGSQSKWPPKPPENDRGVFYVGFPVTETIWLSQREISFGAAPGSGVASSVSETDVSTLICREHLIGVLGKGIPPENFDFSGMSGGPMLMVIERQGLRTWELAGVIYEGPNPSSDNEEAISGLEIIRARRAHFILPDGKLDVARWDALCG